MESLVHNLQWNTVLYDSLLPHQVVNRMRLSTIVHWSAGLNWKASMWREEKLLHLEPLSCPCICHGAQYWYPCAALHVNSIYAIQLLDMILGLDGMKHHMGMNQPACWLHKT